MSLWTKFYVDEILPGWNVTGTKCYRNEMIPGRNVTGTKCYRDKMLPGRNDTWTKFYLDEMLPGWNVTGTNWTKCYDTKQTLVQTVETNKLKHYTNLWRHLVWCLNLYTLECVPFINEESVNIKWKNNFYIAVITTVLGMIPHDNQTPKVCIYSFT